MPRRKKTKYIAVKIDAGHDPNGNPKRGWMIYDDKSYLGFIDEGYEGGNAVWRVLPPEVSELLWLDTIPTTKSFYNELKRDMERGTGYWRGRGF